MIREKHPEKIEYDHAECDACGDSLVFDDPRDDIGYAHHGKLISAFGYGHPYDSLLHPREHVICGSCWQKVMALLDIPIFVEAWGAKYMADGRIVRTPEGEKYEREALEKHGKTLLKTWDPSPKKKE
jgi:hypothetical protein